MGRFNNYQSDLVYTPQTFEKLSVLPMMLRKRHDDMEAQNDLIELNIANTKVAEGFQDAYNQKKQDFEIKAKSLAERMTAEGAGNPSLIKEFQNLKRQYNKDASATGIFGMGKKEYEDMEAARKMEIQYGVEKAGQNPAQVAKKTQETQAKRQAMIREGLAKDPNYIPEVYTPVYAPKVADLTSVARELKDLVGSTGRTDTDDFLKELSDATIPGSEGMLSMDTKSHMYRNNYEQLKDFVKIMNSTILNPSSPINQHMVYNNINPKDYLKDVTTIASMMRTGEVVDIHKKNPMTPPADPNGRGAGSDVDPENSGAALKKRWEQGQDLIVSLPNYNGGDPVKVLPKNARIALQKMEDAEKTGFKEIYSKGYDDIKQATIDVVAKMNLWEHKNKDAMKEAFQKIKPSSDQAINIPGEPKVTYKDYDDFLKKRVQMRNYIEKSFSRPEHAETKAFALREFDERTEEIKDQTREAAGGGNFLYQQQVYGFNEGKASDDMLNSGSKDLMNNIVFIKKQMNEGYASITDENGEVVEKSAFSPDSAKEMRITDVKTSNLDGIPSIGVKMTFPGGAGQPDSIRYVDLEIGSDPGNVARGAVEAMLKNTNDLKTKYVLETVLDSANVNQVIPDSKEYMGTGKQQSGASKAQSDMIIAYNKVSSSGGNKNTIRKDGSYQLLSEGEHYRLRIKQKGDLDYRDYNIGDLLYDKVPRTDATTSRQKQDVKNATVKALSILMGYDQEQGVNSFNQESLPIVPEIDGHKRDILAKSLNDYLYATRAGVKSQQEVDAATNLFIERTKNIGLKTMNKAAFLKN